MRLVVDTDEWYPVYVLRLENVFCGRIVEAPDDLWDRYRRAQEQWENMQEEIIKLYDSALKELDGR